MKNFLDKLISNSQEVSARRFIALLLLPSYITGIVIGILSKSYNFYITAMIAAGLPILIAFFLLTWQHITDLVAKLNFKKHESDTSIPEQ
jgi:hypothetical protein